MTSAAPQASVDLRFGDCLDVLRTLDDESVSACVTDPPYGLADHKPAVVTAALTAWISGDREHVPNGKGFMGRDWDGFVPPPAVWDECLRVLKPGGHLLVFAAPRTMDLMGLSIRLAGFEIRDSIGTALMAWTFGSGMPKGQNVGKAIDKMRKDSGDWLQVGAWLKERRIASGHTRQTLAPLLRGHKNLDSAAANVSNWENGLSFPTWERWGELRELLGFGDEMDAEVWRLNGRKGTPGNERADRVVTSFNRNTYGDGATVENAGTPVLPEAAQWEGWNTSLRPSWEPIIVARKPMAGKTVAANVLAHGTGALNVDACRVAHNDDLSRYERSATSGFKSGGVYGDGEAVLTPSHASGRWPANAVLVHSPMCAESACEDACPVAEMDRQSGTLRGRGNVNPTKRSADASRTAYGTFSGQAEVPVDTSYSADGGASRFFPTFKYQPKAPASERPKIDGKGWPTVKPQGLMRWLVRLVTPPGGLVLDPFAGTSATLQAARDEGFPALGIERDEFAYLLSCKRLGLPELVPATVQDAETDEPVHLAEVAELAPTAEDVEHDEALLDPPADPILVAIEDAQSMSEVDALYDAHEADWRDEHTEAVKARLGELRAAA